MLKIKLDINDNFKNDLILYLHSSKKEQDFEKLKPKLDLIVNIVEKHIAENNISEFKDSGIPIII